MKHLLSVVLVSALTLAGCALGPAHPNADPAPIDRVQLRVALFPWVPNNSSLAQWVETRFEAENPDVDLVVLPMERAETIDFAYSIDATKAALLDPQNPDRQDLIEVDTVTLGALVKARAVQPFSSDRSDFLPFTQHAVTVDGVTYGVPHWTCGYFIMTEFASVAEAASAAALRVRLEGLPGDNPDLGGDIKGSWDSVIVYLNAYLDTYPAASADDALDDTALEPRVRSALDEIGEACTGDGQALCGLDDGSMEERFSQGKLDAFIGYSERLNAILSRPGNTIQASTVRISPAPLGDGRLAMFFTDALVQSPLCTSSRCRDAARRFSAFYVSNATFEALLMSQDQPNGSPPRYLLPSTQGAWSTRRVAGDPVYGQIRSTLPKARGYPNVGIPEARARGEIRTAVDQLLHTPR